LHGDLENAHFLRLIRKSFQDSDIVEKPFWSNLKFEMKFPSMTNEQLEHLLYFSDNGTKIVTLRRVKDVRENSTCTQLHVLPTFTKGMDQNCLKESKVRHVVLA